MNKKILVFTIPILIIFATLFFIAKNKEVDPYFVKEYENVKIESYTGEGVSMEPLLKSDDVVYVQRIPYNELKPGMIVIYNKNQFIRVCHFLLRNDGDGWVSKGYNNDFEDDVLVTDLNYVGIVIKRK